MGGWGVWVGARHTKINEWLINPSTIYISTFFSRGGRLLGWDKCVLSDVDAHSRQQSMMVFIQKKIWIRGGPPNESDHRRQDQTPQNKRRLVLLYGTWAEKKKPLEIFSLKREKKKKTSKESDTRQWWGSAIVCRRESLCWRLATYQSVWLGNGS